MNKSYIEWLDYYENATKEDVIQDMMLDINSIKEKDKEIERLNNIIDELEKYLENEIRLEMSLNRDMALRDVFTKLKELKDKNE